VRPAACVILRAVYKRPRQVEWFVGLQILAAALGGVLVVAARNDTGWEVGLLYLILVLLAYVAMKGFFTWKIWKGKNWARLTMFAWFLCTSIQYFVQLRSGATPIHVEPSLKILIIVVAVLQATSFALLFTRPANEWFRSPRTKQNQLFPQ
jgi:phosphatidylserine synthase